MIKTTERQNKKVERAAYEELRQFREDCKEREAGDRAGGAGRGQAVRTPGKVWLESASFISTMSL